MAWPETGARPGVGVDGRRRVHVVAHHQHRPAHVAHRGEVRQRHHLALAVAHLQLLDVVDRLAERVLGLDVDLPGAAEAVEVVDVVRPERRLQRRAHVVDRHAPVLGLGAVDDQLQPGRVGPEAGEQALQVAGRPRRRPRPCRRSSAGPPGRCRRVSWTMILKPPAVPRPSTGGAPKMFTIAVGHLLLEAAPAARRRWPRRTAPAWCGCSKSSSIRYSAPKLEALALSRIDWPEMATVCLTPGVFRAISSICCTTSLVRATEAASGNCTLTSR